MCGAARKGVSEYFPRLLLGVNSSKSSKSSLNEASPTFSVGVIEGGMQVNFVPDLCRIAIDVRTLPGDTTEGSAFSVRGRFPPSSATADSIKSPDRSSEKNSTPDFDAIEWHCCKVDSRYSTSIGSISYATTSTL